MRQKITCSEYVAGEHKRLAKFEERWNDPSRPLVRKSADYWQITYLDFVSENYPDGDQGSGNHENS